MVNSNTTRSSKGIINRCSLFFLSLIISGCIFTTAVQANAVTRKWKINNQITNMKTTPVPNSPGRVIGFFERQGEVQYEDGEMATQIVRCTFDLVRGAGPYQGYSQTTFIDGSMLLAKIEGVMLARQIGKHPIFKGKGEYISGTGRFKGIQGDINFKATVFKPIAGNNKGDALVECTGTYTLPGK